jgi:uncharacterized protein (UPF0332 family)
MKPNQFLIFAEILLKQPLNPALCRSAVSRAYYGAYHHVKEFIESAGVTILSGPEGHADVWKHLADVGDADIEKVGNDIATLRGMRNEADYKLSELRLEKKPNVDREVENARDIIERIDACISDNARCSSVHAAIMKAHKKLRGLS